MIGMGHNKKFLIVYYKKIIMNVFVLFNKNIYEIIDAFMKTIPIFKASHSKDFMDLNHAMYTPTPQEFESIASGQGSPTCEDLDLEPIHFNVSGNLMSHGLMHSQLLKGLKCEPK